MSCSGLQDHLMGLTPEALSRFRKLEVIARMLHLIQFFLSLSLNGIQILIRDPERQLFLQIGHQIASSAGRFPMMTGDLKEPSMGESTEGSLSDCLLCKRGTSHHSLYLKVSVRWIMFHYMRKGNWRRGGESLRDGDGVGEE